jgi:hypothetical protein
MYSLNVQIRSTKDSEKFGLDPLLTVKEAILFMEHSQLKSNTYSILTRPPSLDISPNHDLVLYSSAQVKILLLISYNDYYKKKQRDFEERNYSNNNIL